MSKFLIIAMVVALVGYFFFKSMNNAKVAPENIRLGDEFLAQNASEEGVQTTASGLQYKVLQPGTGTEHPSASSKVRVHYHGTLLDGTVFDSSVERGEPIEFKLTQVIPGWTEGLQYMVVGEKTRLYIPAKLGYGNRSAGAIQPGSLLIFDVELLAIK
ncbi:peptidylprolyl isomerase [Ferrimonas sediminum]|uniref:Peptidyl-prolyl cis-trans isomerase n=2 Tax=Ferrimonas sediminum TaxID=718193 RepID=A0A1G8ZTD8_9GAMM|nr:peptidylprolyl isomerase [Ferrimonas sediminum]